MIAESYFEIRVRKSLLPTQQGQQRPSSERMISVVLFKDGRGFLSHRVLSELLTGGVSVQLNLVWFSVPPRSTALKLTPWLSSCCVLTTWPWEFPVNHMDRWLPFPLSTILIQKPMWWLGAHGRDEQAEYNVAICFLSSYCSCLSRCFYFPAII